MPRPQDRGDGRLTLRVLIIIALVVLVPVAIGPYIAFIDDLFARLIGLVTL